MVATALRELFLAASIKHQFQYKGQDAHGLHLHGFNRFGIVIYVFNLFLYLVYHLAKGSVMRVPNFLQSKRHKIILECLYIILTALVSLWIPYINNNYKLAGSWCWITAQDEIAN